MANYLTIDIGNTNAKAAAWSGNDCLGSPFWGELSAVDIEHLAAQVNGRFDCAAICSVGSGFAPVVEAAKVLSDKVLIVNGDSRLPISLDAYYPASNLGPDRIAALCGAHSLCPGQDVLVVDCGTCVTYDLLSAEGRFLGGNIAPGLGMRLRAMHQFTAKLPLVDSDSDPALWGTSTATAMQGGAFFGIVAEIQYYISACPKPTRLILAGGRSSDLLPHLGNLNPTFCPALVLQGLKHIIDYNEN